MTNSVDIADAPDRDGWWRATVVSKWLVATTYLRSRADAEDWSCRMALHFHGYTEGNSHA